MPLRSSGRSCPNVTRGRLVGRDKRSGSVVDNFVQEASFQLRYVYCVESTRALPSIGAGFDTRPARRLPSRDAPEFVPPMDATPTGHLVDSISLSALFLRSEIPA